MLGLADPKVYGLDADRWSEVVKEEAELLKGIRVEKGQMRVHVPSLRRRISFCLLQGQDALATHRRDADVTTKVALPGGVGR